LPDSLSPEPKIAWRKPLTGEGLGGVAVAAGKVFVVDRDVTDKNDIFRCLDAASGTEIWAFQRPGAGKLDYGASPRATPLIADGRVYVLSAFGRFYALDAAKGDLLWSKNLRADYAAVDDLVWGTASSPLIAEGKLILNPGGPHASLVALDPKAGEELWRTPGAPSAFSSFIVVRIKGQPPQLVGFDKDSLGGWDLASGKRKWTLPPVEKGEFNVPTPIFDGERLIVSTEIGCTRIFEFDDEGVIKPKPIAENFDLAPDTHSPILTAGRLFGAWQNLYCLDAANGLAEVWKSTDIAYSEYSTILASPTRVLVTTQNADVILIDAQGKTYEEKGRWKLWPKESGLYSHPAVAGEHFFVRGSRELLCIDLAAK
jgi:outer membrane protein assembly factor BamB